MRTLTEIADQLDQAANSLMVMAQTAAGPGNEDQARAEIYSEDGELIDLRSLANDLRRHAQS